MDKVFAAIARAVFERYLGTVVDGYIILEGVESSILSTERPGT